MVKKIKLEPGTDPTSQVNPLPGRNYMAFLIWGVTILACLILSCFGGTQAWAAFKQKTPTPAVIASPTLAMGSQTPSMTAGIAITGDARSTPTLTPSATGTIRPTGTPAIFVTVIRDVQSVEVTRIVPVVQTAIVVQTSVIVQMQQVTVQVPYPVIVIVTATPGPPSTISPTSTMTASPSATPSPTPTMTASPTPSETPIEESTSATN
jgi:hypothetical protein